MWFWIGAIAVGVCLSVTAELSLPKGTDMRPRPPIVRTTNGIYKYMRHPMYVGNVALLTGLAGLGGGIFTALSVGILAKMLMQHWAGLERQ